MYFSPKKICSLIDSRLKNEFGIYVDLVLKTWKINSSADIGTVVFDLAEYHCLKLSGSETLKDFENVGIGNLK